MPHPSTSTLDDLFAALEVAPDASQEDIKRAYRRLLLIYHPDKLGSTETDQDAGEQDTERVILLTHAYRVLSDPALRAEYESRPAEVPRAQQGTRQRNPTRTISLEEFTFHPSPDDGGCYTHPCRCSGEYKIAVDELEQGVDIVGCEGCGEWVGVGYEVVDDDAEEVDDDAEES